MKHLSRQNERSAGAIAPADQCCTLNVQGIHDGAHVAVSRPDILASAWAEVKANRGGAGVDGDSIAAIEARGVGSFLEELRANLLAHQLGEQRPLARGLL